MEEYVTIAVGSPELKKYLQGCGRDGLRAVPVRTLNVSQPNQQMTFRLISQASIKRPAVFKILLQIIRVDLLPLTAMPAMTVLVFLSARSTERSLGFWALASLLFLHAAVFCRNDFIDHMNGVNRVHEKGGSRVIEEGWVVASTVQKFYWWSGAVSLLLAIPIFFAKPELSIYAIVVAVIGVFGYTLFRWQRLHWGLADLAVFLCLGPLLTAGMSWALITSFDRAALLIGAILGLFALALVELKHLISIVVDDEAGLATMPVKLGFDRAKNFVSGILFAVVVGFVFVCMELQAGLFSLSALPLVGFIIYYALQVKGLKSPLSSKLNSLPRRLSITYLACGLNICFLTLI